MGEFIDFLKHIIILIDKYNNFFGAISDLISIFVGIITGVSLIIGLNYLKTYKEKTSAATFTFWSQIKVRIKELSTMLKADNRLIDNLYCTDIQKDFEQMSTKAKDVKVFKEKVEQMIDYIEKAPDQMPAYIGWTNDYDKLTEFLYDVIVYDICNPNDRFKFNDKEHTKDRKEFCEEICTLMDRICTQINNRQSEIENKICKKLNFPNH